MKMGKGRRAAIEIERQARVDPPKLLYRELGRRGHAPQLPVDLAHDGAQLQIERPPGRLEQGEEGLGFGLRRGVLVSH
jgi:hypothetical protein